MTERADAEIVAGFNRLGLRLLAAESTRDNQFLSPLSIAVCVAMPWPGARAQTRAELEGLLGIEPGANLGEQVAALLAALAPRQSIPRVVRSTCE